MGNQANGGDGWWTHKEVQEYLKIDPRTLRKRMDETPAHITVPWLNIGTQRKPRFHWQKGAVDNWWIEVNRWRASQNETTATPCAGGTQAASQCVSRFQIAQQQRSSRRKSRARGKQTAAGPLTTYVKCQT